MKLKQIHYSWVMVIIAVSVIATHAPVMYTFGIFLKPLTMEFNWDRGVLSGAFSMFLLLGGFLGIPSGRLSDKYGPRILVTISGLLTGLAFLLMSQVNSLWHVYSIWGLIMGIGSSGLFVPITSTIPRWFIKNRGIAMGLTVAGMGLGGVISAPLTQWFISSYGWQQAFIILGLVTIIIIPSLAQFLKHSPQRVGLKPYGEDGTIEDKQPLASTIGGFSFNQAIKTGHFWFFGLVLFSAFFTVQVINIHIIPYVVDIGIPAMVAASFLSIISVTGVIGRSLIGFVCDKIGARPALIACLATLTLALIWLLFAQEIWMFYVFAVFFGVAYGGIVPIEMLVTAELFGFTSLGVILGSLILFGLAGGASGATLAGSIFDVTGSYSLAFLICVIIGALAIILSLILLKAKGWRGGE